MPDIWEIPFEEIPMTDAPAPSAEVEKALVDPDYILGLAREALNRRDIADRLIANSHEYTDLAIREAERVRDRAYDAFCRAATAEREWVKALEVRARQFQQDRDLAIDTLTMSQSEREAEASERANEAEARTTAAEAQVKEMREERDKWRDDYFKARDALHPLTYPPDPQMLRAIADEIDCGRDCETGYTEYDTGAFVCRKEDRGECGFAKAEELRAFAAAVEIRATLAATKEGA